MVDKVDKDKAASAADKKAASAPPVIVQQFAGQITPGQETIKFSDLGEDVVFQYAGQITPGQKGQSNSDVLPKKD